MLSTFISYQVIKYTWRQKETVNRANEIETLFALFTATVPELASDLTWVAIPPCSIWKLFLPRPPQVFLHVLPIPRTYCYSKVYCHCCTIISTFYLSTLYHFHFLNSILPGCNFNIWSRSVVDCTTQSRYKMCILLGCDFVWINMISY